MSVEPAPSLGAVKFLVNACNEGCGRTELKVKLWVQDSLELPMNSTFLIYAPRCFAPDVNECGTHAVNVQ